MYSTVQNPVLLLRQRLDLMSPLDTAVFVLFTSFVGHLFTIPTLQASSPGPRLPINVFTTWSLDPGCPFFSSASRPCAPLYPDFLPRSMALPVAVLLAFVTYGSALTSFTLVYRLSPFHPLAKYPGPAIAKTSKLWAVISQRHGRHA